MPTPTRFPSVNPLKSCKTEMILIFSRDNNVKFKLLQYQTCAYITCAHSVGSSKGYRYANKLTE